MVFYGRNIAAVDAFWLWAMPFYAIVMCTYYRCHQPGALYWVLSLFI